MAGVVLETLSNRKLLILGGFLLLLQIIFFLIGGLVAPKPSNVQQIIATKCVDKEPIERTKAFYSRGDGSCERVHDFEEAKKKGYSANEIVFSFQFPLPRENKDLEMSRWFQHIISVLYVDVEDSVEVPYVDEGHLMTMDAYLGYRNKDDDPDKWTEIARSTENRTITCERMSLHEHEEDFDLEGQNFTHPSNKKDTILQCDILPLFEIGSCHYDYYLVNIRIPVDDETNQNADLPQITDLHMVAIHQNGGFTKVWLSIKTCVFPILMAVLIWFWKRIASLERPPRLIEKTLFALGLSLSFLNLPVEWMTLWFNMPFMLLLSDIRQGIFYSILLCFWIIFAGEHMMDQVERNRLVIYWRHLAGVVFGCICLFVFEMCERGVQMNNPFYNIWVTETGKRLALAFIILAGISACVYFLFLCGMVYRVYRNISAKKTSLPSMNKTRRKFYMGLIYRFKFLMLGTLVCAAITVIFFIISQVSEGHWKWDDEGQKLEYTSAFFTGVYGMWNIYVFGLLILYAPSHKYMKVLDTDTATGSNEEEVEFESVPTEASAMTAFAQKTAAD